MRHLRSSLYLLSLILSLLFVAVSWGQPTGGGIGFFNSIEVNDSIYNYGFARQFYSGSGTMHRASFIGSSGLVFNWRINGTSAFLMDAAGSIYHTGPFTTYMLGLRDTDRTNALVFKFNENESADRVINWSVNGANRNINLSADFTLSVLTNSRLLATDGAGDIGTTSLNSWVTGTPGEVIITDDGDGTITIASPGSGPVLGDIVVSGTGMSGGANDVLPGPDVDVDVILTTEKDIVAGTGLTGGADNVLPGADSDVTINADANLLVAGTANQVIVADDLDGTITLSTPQNTHTGASPTFVTTTLSGLTASRLVSSDGTKNLESSDATAWIAGAANDVTVGDDADGSVTLSTVNLGDIVAGTGLTGGSNDVLPGADADVTINADANLLVAGTADDVTVTDDLDGTITLSTVNLGDIVAGTGLTGGSNDVLPGGDADVTINADANLLVAGTADDITVTDDLDGTITLSTVPKAGAVTVGATGCDYTTIQAALTANVTAILVLVYPGTYTNDTINFTANGQTIEGVGCDADILVTSADAQICNFGAFIGVCVDNLTMEISGATTAKDVIVGSGFLELHSCTIRMISSTDIVGGAQPSCINTTGDVYMFNGMVDYNHTGESVAGIKAAIRLGAAASVNFSRVVVDLDTEGDAFVTVPAYGTSTGIFDPYRCVISVTNIPEAPGSGLEDTLTIGHAYTTGSGSHEVMNNIIRVENDGSTGIGFYGGGTVTVRSMMNHIHVTSSTGVANSYYFGAAGATIIAQLDDVIAAGGVDNGAGGTFVYAYSEEDGDFSVSDEWTVVGEATFTPSAAQVINAVGDDILVNASAIVLDPDADYTLTSTPTIANGVSGQMVYIMMGSGEANVVTIQDQDILGGSNLQLLADSRDITAQKAIMLLFDGTDWVEVGSNQIALEETVFPPSAAQVINAVGDAVLANATLVILNPDGDYTLTSEPTIANGTTGQVLYITAANAEGNSVILQDETELPNSNLRLMGSEVEVTGQTIVGLIFDGVNWVEFGTQITNSITNIRVKGNLIIEGPAILDPSSTQVIDAVGDTILADATLVILNPDADYILTSTPTIADGTTGQFLLISCDNAEANTVTLQDEGLLGASNLRLKSLTSTVVGKKAISFVFDGTDWIETGQQDIGSFQVTIVEPDLLNAAIPVFHADMEKYPRGVIMMNVQITIPVDAAYSMVFEEWAGDPPAAQADIETVTTGGADAYMEVRTTDIDNRDIDADDYIFLDIPATDVDWIQCAGFFYAK